jgi:hypothetical protein
MKDWQVKFLIGVVLFCFLVAAYAMLADLAGQ